MRTTYTTSASGRSNTSIPICIGRTIAIINSNSSYIRRWINIIFRSARTIITSLRSNGSIPIFISRTITLISNRSSSYIGRQISFSVILRTTWTSSTCGSTKSSTNLPILIISTITIINSNFSYTRRWINIILRSTWTISTTWSRCSIKIPVFINPTIATSTSNSGNCFTANTCRFNRVKSRISGTTTRTITSRYYS